MNLDLKQVVIVDYGLGNLFSVERSLKHIGAEVEITGEREKITNADYLVLPGVGSFGDGMMELKERNLIEPIIEFVESGRPFLGICLGMQLLMTVGYEFGMHEGLNFAGGKVVKLTGGENKIKIPHVGWNSLLVPRHAPNVNDENAGMKDSYWKNTILENIKPGVFVYFVHSYVVVPDDPQNVLAETKYGDNIFCSALRKDNIFGCQFHPEKSGEVGLDIYRQFLRL